MEKEAGNHRSSCLEVDVKQQRLDERLDGPEELPDDYAQWLDQRRFDDQQEVDQ